MVSFGQKKDLSCGREKWTSAARHRKTFSFAAVAALFLLAIGTSACLYIPAIPDDPTPIPGWNENKVQPQKNGTQLQQSAEGHSDSSSEVVSTVAAKPSWRHGGASSTPSYQNGARWTNANLVVQ